MQLRPLHDRVLVHRLEEGEQRQGRIIIPDSAKEKPQQATVKAVGSGKLLETGERSKPEVKAGDRILFGKYSGLGYHYRRRGIPDFARGRDPRRPGLERPGLRLPAVVCGFGCHCEARPRMTRNPLC